MTQIVLHGNENTKSIDPTHIDKNFKEKAHGYYFFASLQDQEYTILD